MAAQPDMADRSMVNGLVARTERDGAIIVRGAKCGPLYTQLRARPRDAMDVEPFPRIAR